jgi:hypothetical protein
MALPVAEPLVVVAEAVATMTLKVAEVVVATISAAEALRVAATAAPRFLTKIFRSNPPAAQTRARAIDRPIKR